jgi:hypothetical protein
MNKGLVLGIVLAVGVIGCGKTGATGPQGEPGQAGPQGEPGEEGSLGGTCEVASDAGGKNITITCPNTSVTFKVSCPGNSCK